MDKGRLTVSQLKAEVGVTYKHILDIWIENKENEHGRMVLLLEVAEELQLKDIALLQGTQTTVKLPNGNILFSGICKGTSFQEQTGYKTLKVEVFSSTIAMDETRRTETYQNPFKNLEDIISTITQKYAVYCQLQKNPSIKDVIYQKEETDWEFIKRLVNQYNQQVYAETRNIQPGIAIGTNGLRLQNAAILSHKVSTSKDIAELRVVRSNVDGSAASYQFEREEYLCEDLTIIPGDTIGRDTVRANYITNQGGILENRIVVAKTAETKPDYELTISKLSVNNILTGTVLDVAGNILQIQFDTDIEDMRGKCVDVPYESPISNSFYCMPDIGDMVFVYYENNGKIICLGSKRGSTEHTDFQKHQEKLLTSHDKMIRFTENEVKLTATREKSDAGDDTEISILLDDAEGITITSGKDITIETTDGMDIALNACDPETVPQQLYEALKKGQENFLVSASKGNQTYVSEGGMDFWERQCAISSQRWDQSMENLQKNFVDTFTFVNLRKAIGMLSQDDIPPVEEQEIEQEQYTRGVLTIYGLNTVTLQVKRSVIVLDVDVYIGADAFNWLGYSKGEHEPAIEEYKDWFELGLDIIQLGLDIAGFFCPICDVINAAISLVRGDVAGTLLSLIAIIPVIGDGLKSVSSVAKVAEKIDSASKFGKIIKTTNVIWSGVSYVDQIPSMGIASYEIMQDGKFDLTDPTEWQKLVSIVKGFVGIKSFKDNLSEVTSPSNTTSDTTTTPRSDSATDTTTPRSDSTTDTVTPRGEVAAQETQIINSTDSSTPGSQTQDATTHTNGGGDDTLSSQNNDGPETARQDSDTTSDPINVVTGSLLAEYVDLSIEDILGSYDLKRYYESAFDNRGGLLGDKWRFGMESSISFQGDCAVVQLPDLHLEKFYKRNGNWENLHTDDKSYILVETEEGFVFRKRDNETLYEYNRKGQLTGSTDIHGNRTKLLYAGTVLERIQLASGGWISFRYQDGKVKELEDNIGRKVSYTYQGNYLHTASLPNGGTMRYEYTKEGFISCAYDMNGKWYTKNYYDRKGRVIRQELAGGEEYVVFYDDVNKQNTFLTVSDGNSIIYQYGNEKLAKKIIYPDRTTVEKRYNAGKNVIYEKDRKGNETFRIFNENGLLLEERMPNGFVRNYEYDADNRLTRMYDNTGRESLKEYDTDGNMLYSRVRLDKETFATTAFTYDSKGRILSMTDSLGNTEKYTYDLPISRPTKYITSTGNVIRYTYDNAGRLIEVEDELGKKSYGYNNLGQRIIVRDEEGNATRFYYDNMANLVKKIRPNAYDVLSDDGEGTVYEYDVWENLTRVIYPDGGISSFENDFYGKLLKESGEFGEKKYEYDADHNRIRSIYPDGGVLREIFDANANLTKRILPQQYDANKDDGAGYTYEYDSCNRLTQITNSLGTVEHRYIYDLAGQLVKDIDAKGYLGAATDEERIGTLYCYDFLGMVTEVRKPLKVMEEGAAYQLTSYRYDSYGNCIEEKRYLDYQTIDSARGRVNCIHYSYDKANRLVHIHDSLGACMEYGYNCRSQRVFEKRKIADGIWQERHYFYSASGRIERIMDSADEKGCGRKYTPTYFTYDKNGNITCIKTASGYEILREYDVCDRLTAEIHQDKNEKISNRTEYVYDREGRLIEQKMQDGYTVSYCYDTMGRLVEQKDSRGAVQSLKYDLNGNLVSRLNPQEGCQSKGYHYGYDILGRNTEITALNGSRMHYTCYNTFGEKVQEGDCMGGIRFTYDFAGRRILAETERGSSQSYEYDACGNITALKDGNGNRTVYETDLWGRITRTEKADGSAEAYAYDYAGNVVAATDENGNRVTYCYNSQNRLAARIDAAGCEETFLYDMEGRMCEHTDREGRSEKYFYNLYGSPVLHKNAKGDLTESWEYDSMGRLKSAIGGGMRYDYTYYQGGLIKEKKASGRVLISYEYDNFGRKTAQTDLTGKCTEYRYDQNGMVEEIWENDHALACYSYYPDGTLRSLNIGQSLSTEYTYDREKNTTGMKTMLDGKTLLVDNLYEYDRNGNCTLKQELEGSTRYSYDANNRLIEVQYPNLMNGASCYEKLSYDKAGNRTLRITESLTEQYHYDSCNRLTRLDTTPADLSKPQTIRFYRYDKQGNMLSDGANTYSYDSFNRVGEVHTEDGSIQKNRYDAEGLRHEMEENGQLVQFLYSGREVVAETESDGNIIRYIRGLGLISSDSESAKTYYHYVSDEHGSITHVTEGESKESNTQGQTAEHQVLNSYTYDAFGNTIACEEQVHNRFRYLGEQYDTVSQQYYLRARYYNPVIGRFTQEDTYYGDGLNLYQYCANNPVRYKDPSGHGAVEQNPYQRYQNEGAHPVAIDLAGQLYPDLASKQHLVDKYKAQGYKAADALELANRELLFGAEAAESYAAQNMTKAFPDATQPYDPNSDFRLQQRLYESGSNSAYKFGNNIPTSQSLTRQDIINSLNGVTDSSTLIANAIQDGKIKINVLGDELFESYLGVSSGTTAVQVGNQIYMRSSSASIYSDVVHEGTHAMDFINNISQNEISSWPGEIRAYSAERLFQIESGMPVEFATENDMLIHIWSNYSR